MSTPRNGRWEEIVAWLHTGLGVPEELFDKLKEETDWGFLVKWHAILETAVNHLLATHFKKPEAALAFARLEMSNPKTGKMAFVTACDLLPQQQRIFIQKLSEMRNDAVHDIKNFNFSFADFRHRKIKPDERKTWQKQISFVLPLEGKEMAGNAILRRRVEIGCARIIVEIFHRHVSPPIPARFLLGLPT